MVRRQACSSPARDAKHGRLSSTCPPGSNPVQRSYVDPAIAEHTRAIVTGDPSAESRVRNSCSTPTPIVLGACRCGNSSETCLERSGSIMSPPDTVRSPVYNRKVTLPMSRLERLTDRPPLIALVEKAARILAADMVRAARANGRPEIRLAHNAVFSTLFGDAARTSDMAARAGITKQSMGEVVRELVDLGILEMNPDPDDRRAKLVTYTDHGVEVTMEGRRYLEQLEQEFVARFGKTDYEAARRVLTGVIEGFGSDANPGGGAEDRDAGE
jgi:DNA-binding MarR family transcriptional regulator